MRDALARAHGDGTVACAAQNLSGKRSFANISNSSIQTLPAVAQHERRDERR